MINVSGCRFRLNVSFDWLLIFVLIIGWLTIHISGSRLILNISSGLVLNICCGVRVTLVNSCFSGIGLFHVRIVVIILGNALKRNRLSLAIVLVRCGVNSGLRSGVKGALHICLVLSKLVRCGMNNSRV